MTTSDTTTTENTPQHMAETRTVRELLALGTYQGMSDTEIDSLIDYWVGVRIREDVVLAEINSANMAREEIINQNKAACARMDDVVKSLLGNRLVLETNDGEVSE